MRMAEQLVKDKNRKTSRRIWMVKRHVFIRLQKRFGRIRKIDAMKRQIRDS